MFIEKQPEAVEILRKNLNHLADSPFEVIPVDLLVALGMLEGRGLVFDVIFLDPPYAGGELDRALRLVSNTSLLKPDGLLIAEHDARAGAPSSKRLVAERTVTYGGTSLTFYRWARPAAIREV